MNQENQKIIDSLNLQIELISNENLAQKILIDALILSHQNHRHLAACISREKDMFLARVVSENIPDDINNSVIKDLDRALKHAIALS